MSFDFGRPSREDSAQKAAARSSGLGFGHAPDSLATDAHSTRPRSASTTPSGRRGGFPKTGERVLALTPRDRQLAAASIFHNHSSANVAEIIGWADADIAERLRILVARLGSNA